MAIQPGTFKRLPPKEEILELIADQKRHDADVTSYVWYLMPLADRFGDGVYEVAAESLARSGLEVSASRLKELGQELRTPEGLDRCSEERRLHLSHVTG